MLKKLGLLLNLMQKKLVRFGDKFAPKINAKINTKIIIGLGIVVIVVLIVIFSIIRSHSTTHTADIPVTTVETLPVKQQTIPVIVAVSGSLNAVQKVDISPEVEGQVAKIEFNDGQHVTAGSVLFQLDDSIPRAQLAQYRARLKLSQQDFHRNYKLLQTDAFSPKQLDATKEALEENKALVEQYRLTVQKMQIVAPFTGTVSSSKVSVGQHVTSQNSLVTLVNNDNLKVIYHVSEDYLSKLKLGQPVMITSDILPGKKFFAKVSYIAPLIDEATRTIEVNAMVANNEQQLAPGMFVEVKQVLGRRKKALMIPVQALQRDISGDKVYVVKKNHAIEIPVKVGLRIGDEVEITRGLTADDVIVIAGQQKIRDGSLVQTVTPKKAAA